jgi:ComF family protein
MLDALLGLLFPDRCAGCRRLGGLFCGACRATLTGYGGEDDLALADLTAVRIAFVFDGPLREAIHTLKYARRRRMARPLGALLAAHLRARPLPAAALLPVPLHPTRLAERGFNQAAELARALARDGARPLLERGLERVRATSQQAQLNAAQRRENTRGAFVWRAAAPPPERVLLVDDVLTTGATLSACAAALRQAGAREIYAAALARSR